MSKLNIPNLVYLAEWLEGGAKHVNVTFDLGVGIRLIPAEYDETSPTACGTNACIAGAAVQFFSGDDWLNDTFRQFRDFDSLDEDDEDENEVAWDRVFFQAQDLLGLTRGQAIELFVPPNKAESDNIYTSAESDVEFYNDAAWAARVVRNLIATGEVDWKGQRQL